MNITTIQMTSFKPTAFIQCVCHHISIVPMTISKFVVTFRFTSFYTRFSNLLTSTKLSMGKNLFAIKENAKMTRRKKK